MASTSRLQLQLLNALMGYTGMTAPGNFGFTGFTDLWRGCA